MAASQTISKKGKSKNGVSRFLPMFLFCGIILIFILVAKLLSRTVPNDPEAVGNTACNLYNGGSFCLYDDTIYFSNLQDNGALYSMSTSLTGYKRLHDDMPGYLNAASHYLVYARLNYKRDGGGKAVLEYTNSGLFRINRKNGSNMRMIYSKPVGVVSLYGNDVYYQHYDKTEGIDLYQSPLDCSDNIPVLDSNLIPACIYNGNIYYSGTEQDHYIYSFTPSVGKPGASGFLSGTETLIYRGNCYQPARIGNSIYFISLSQNYSIARVDTYGGNPTLLVQEHCSSYNVDQYENYLVYQVDDGENSRLECMNLNTLEIVTIRNGNFCGIHILDDLVFFQEFGTTRQYYFRLGHPEASLFLPEIKD